MTSSDLAYGLPANILVWQKFTHAVVSGYFQIGISLQEEFCEEKTTFHWLEYY